MAKQVHQYDLNGRYLKSYKSIAEAAKAAGRDESSIRDAASNHGRLSAYSLWSYHKRESYADTDVVDDFLTQHNIPPEEVTKTRVQETKDGL